MRGAWTLPLNAAKWQNLWPPHSIEITISPFFAKLILRFNPFHRMLVMCRGYNEDYKNFTELVWEDDKNLDFSDHQSYPQFQIWFT